MIRWALLSLMLLSGCPGGSDAAPETTDGGPGSDVPAEPDAPTPLLTGTVRYLKRTVSADGVATAYRGCRGVRVELRRPDDGVVLATGATDTGGQYAIEWSGLGPVSVVAIARAEGPRINLTVHKAEPTDPPWSVAATDGATDIDIDEPFAAGAFNVVELAWQVSDALEGLVDPAPPTPGLIVRYDQDVTPGCGSCFFVLTHRLDLGGWLDDEDAHDDSVVLHELGHWVEAQYGYYSNPTGPHDLQHVRATLAWSEGFATWFQAMIRGVPDFLDLRPNNTLYTLNLETPPAWVNGASGAPTSEDFAYSEAVVYGVLWDLIDDPPDDDDPASWTPADVLEAAMGLSEEADLAQAGADFTDWVNAWRCLHPEDDAALQAGLDTFDFPYDTGTPAICP